MPLINGGYVLRDGSEVVALEIDLYSKYCNVVLATSSMGIPGIQLIATKESLHLGDYDKDITKVELPEYKGWSAFSASVSRYTLRVCLIKDRITN